MANFNSTKKGSIEPFKPGIANQLTDYKDMSRPTKETTNQDHKGNTRPGPVDLRATIDKNKDINSTANTLKYLDENVKDRHRYSANNPQLGEPYSALQTLAQQSLRRYGDMHPGTVDGEVIMMFIEFANLVLEDLRAHPYWDNLEIDYYIHPTEHRQVPDQIMIAGLLYHYSVQQQSNKVEAYGPMYFRTMNRILFNRKYGNAKIEVSPMDRGAGNLANSRGYDVGRS